MFKIEFNLEFSSRIILKNNKIVQKSPILMGRYEFKDKNTLFGSGHFYRVSQERGTKDFNFGIRVF